MLKFMIVTGAGKIHKDMNREQAVEVLRAASKAHDKFCTVMVRDDESGKVPENFIEIAAEIEKVAKYQGASESQCVAALEKTIGRPPLRRGETRKRINTTVRPTTISAIRADANDGESLGQVLDRWALERAAK